MHAVHVKQRQNSVFPLFGLGLGLRLGLGLEFGLGLGLGLFWHLRQNSLWDYFASKWQNNMGLFCLQRQNSHCLITTTVLIIVLFPYSEFC